MSRVKGEYFPISKPYVKTVSKVLLKNELSFIDFKKELNSSTKQELLTDTNKLEFHVSKTNLLIL